ncbi:MAG: hypothetical protein ACLPSF_02810 [Methylocella sp.]
MGVIVPLRRAGFRSIRGMRSFERAGDRTLLDGILTDPAAYCAAPEPTGARRPQSRDAPLDCLAGAAFARHFHSWRGASGKRYICSVFPIRDDAELGGLPEFDQAIALAVSCDGQGRRQKIAVLDLSWRDGRFAGDLRSAGEAISAGASEWHIHLLAGEGDARRAAIADIAS